MMNGECLVRRSLAGGLYAGSDNAAKLIALVGMSGKAWSWKQFSIGNYFQPNASFV
jgi:hypothetical protein